MKTNRIILISLFILGISYFILDKQLFYYGKSDLNIYSSLPFKIKPEYRYSFEGGFVLWDNYDFAIFGQGVVFDSITIKEVLNYGFNKNSLVAFVKDKNNRLHILKYSSNNDKSSPQDFVVKATTKMELKNYDYRWIEIADKENYIEKLSLIRNYLLIVVSITFLILIYRSFFRKKRNNVGSVARVM